MYYWEKTKLYIIQHCVQLYHIVVYSNYPGMCPWPTSQFVRLQVWMKLGAWKWLKVPAQNTKTWRKSSCVWDEARTRARKSRYTNLKLETLLTILSVQAVSCKVETAIFGWSRSHPKGTAPAPVKIKIIVLKQTFWAKFKVMHLIKCPNVYPS